MAGARSMLTRVRRLEAARAPVLSPIAAGWGSFDAFAGWAAEQIEAGVLDSRDFPVVVTCLASWERDGIWGQRLTPGERATWR